MPREALDSAPAMPRQLYNAGPPIDAFWAWIVIDDEGREAVAAWIGSNPAVGPDRDLIGSAAVEQMVRHRYAGWRVELRRFVAA